MSFIFEATHTGSAELDLHLEHVRKVDWAATSLGPIVSWPQDLLQLAHIMMLDSQPRLLLLGSKNWMLYNIAYAKAVAGDKHPKLLGQTQVDAWAEEVEVEIIEAPNAIRDAGFLPGYVHEYHVPLLRNGFLEECVLNWTTIPLAGDLTGVYVSLTDVTKAHVAKRRATALSHLEKVCNAAKRLEDLWQCVPECLTSNVDNFSFALLFSVASPLKASASNDGSSFRLEQSAGNLKNVQELTEELENSRSLAEAMVLSESTMIGSNHEDFAKSWSQLFKEADERNAAVICPLAPNKSESAMKMLVVGLSAKNPFDDAYRTWISQLTQLMRDTIASLVLAAEENQRRMEARNATLARAQASEKEASKITERLLRMQYIVDQVDVGIFELLPNGILVQSNDAYHALSGIPEAHKGIEQLAFADYIYPQDRDYVMNQWATMTSGSVTTFEMRWKAPINAYGEEFQWVLAACIPLMNESGTVTSVYGCTTNIGPQKRAEGQTRARAEALESLRVSEQRFRTFMDHAPVAVIVNNENREVTYANSNWFDLSEHPRVDDYRKIDWSSTVFAEDLPRVAAVWDNMVAGESISIEFRLNASWKSEDGRWNPKWISAMVWPEMDANGAMKQAIATMTDISHFKLAEGVSKLRIEQAIEAKRQQENFIDMTSHEIRNPLSAVVHCTDAISDSLQEMDVLVSALMFSPEQDKARQLHEYIEGSLDAANTIKSCTTHQKRIVDDILVLSKLDSNLLQISPSRVEAMTILRNIDKMFEAEAARECVNITTIADSSIKSMDIHWLLLDHGRIDQVLINLITNAIKFTKNRERRNITITMGASMQRPSESDRHLNFGIDFTLGQSLRDSIYDTPEFCENEMYLWFAVEDTGRGITQEEKMKVFGRFQQASPKTYSEYGGSGLGLYISHSLVGLQGGEIGVATEPGVGSTFSFFVKTSRCAAPILDVVDALSSTKLTEQPNRNMNGTARRVSVLIVEDNLLNQRVLKKQLSKNYDVYTADHGQEALDFLKTTRHWNLQPSTDKHVDVILMDLEMPVMGGLECSRTIRELQKAGSLRGHIPIIAVSANARPEQVNEALAAGMDDAISKPFRIPDLVPKIDRLVR